MPNGEKMNSAMTATFKKAQDEIDSQLNANAPVILIAKANNALDSIDYESAGFKNNSDSIIEGLNKIIEKANSLKSLIK